MEQHAMNRRNFLKGALATGAFAASGAVLASCSPAQSKDDAGSGAKGDAAATKAVPTKGYECSEDWLGEKPSIADGDITSTKEFDIVVCGAGNAGVQAALAVAQEGAKVAVLEIQPEATWNQLGNDICAFNAQWLIEKGYGPYKTGDIVAEFVRRGGGRVSA
ncbi:MAG: FAD-dependent oxidoreductase, partial [Raoultibacter sp.]